MFNILFLVNVVLCFYLTALVMGLLDIFSIILCFELIWVVLITIAGLTSICLLNIGALFFTLMSLCLSAVELGVVISMIFNFSNNS